MGRGRSGSVTGSGAVLVPFLVLALGIAACAGGVDIDTSVTGQDLSRSNGCGDAEVYAATDDGQWALVATIDGLATDIREGGGPVERTYDLPHEDLHLALWTGHRVTASLCTDVDDQDHEVVARWRATAGRVQVRAEMGDGEPSMPQVQAVATDLTFEPSSHDTLDAIHIDRVRIGPATVGWFPG